MASGFSAGSGQVDGPTVFGGANTDTHIFTGSLFITGNVSVGSSLSASGGVTASYGVIGGIHFLSGSKISGSSPVVITGSGCDISLAVSGTISASCAVSASSFWKDGVELTTGGSPASPVNSIQFNEASSFGGDAQFTWNTTTQFLAITGTSDATPAVGISGAFYVGGGQGINSDPDGITAGTGSIGLGYYGYDSGGEEDKYAITLYGISGESEGERYTPYIDIGTTDGDSVPGVPATNITIGSTGSNVTLAGGEVDATAISIGSSDASRILLAGTSLTSSVDWEFDLSVGTGLITLAEMDTAAKGIRFVNGKSEDIGSGVFVIGKINSSSAGGIDIDLYTGSLKNVTTLTASSHVSASTFYGDGSSLTGIGGGSPGGSDTQIQYNNGGSFGGAPTFKFNDSTGQINISGASSPAKLVIGDDAGMYAAQIELASGMGHGGGGDEHSLIKTINGTGLILSGANKIVHQTVNGSEFYKNGTKIVDIGVTADTLVATKLSSSFISNTYFSASISSSVNATCSLYNVFNYHLTDNSEVTASSPMSGTSYLFFFRQDGTGAHTVDFSGFKWPGGTAPTLSTAASAVDIVSGISDGTYIYADTTKNFS